MELHTQKYYHLYNRTNNNELLFKERKNYSYFLNNFFNRFEKLISVYAYCLMPTHFHFLIKVETENTDQLRNQIGIHLSAYTKAINKMYNRHGSLFQRHTKAKLIESDEYLLTLLNYIHQNPVRLELVRKVEEWPYSSYQELAGVRKGGKLCHDITNHYFTSRKEFISFSNVLQDSVKR